MGFFKWLSGRKRNLVELAFVHGVGVVPIVYFISNGLFTGDATHNIMVSLMLLTVIGAMGGMWYGLYDHYKDLKNRNG